MAEKEKESAKKAAPKKKASAKATVAPPSHDAIAARAYEIWCATRGSAEENWLQAERELERGS